MKEMIYKQQKAQVVRLFRPKEFQLVLNNLTLDDATAWVKGRETQTLKELGFDNESLKTIISFMLYSGMRFSEVLLIHNYTDPLTKKKKDLINYDKGYIHIPRYKGKVLRTIQTRNVYLSYKGIEIAKKFMNIPSIPSNPKNLQSSLIELTTILHKAGKKANLSEENFTYEIKRIKRNSEGNPLMKYVETKNFVQNADNTYSKQMKQVEDVDIVEKVVTTNGCTVRSLRKTWESWLIKASYTNQNVALKDAIFTSQGHMSTTAWNYYLNTGFDKEDLEDILEEVKGYGGAFI